MRAHCQELLTARGLNTGHCRLACFSAAGFSDALRRRADDGDAVLVGLADLYR
jgi:hypothetical protein